MVLLTVSDSGPGISPKDKEQLFLPYFSTKDRGTGLGLAIGHQIVSAHDGNIRATSKPGQGTTLTIELPLTE